MRVALTYNLKKETGEAKDLPPDFYAECDEPETVIAVRDAIEERHGEVSMIEADEDAFEKLRRTRPDIVFNMAEGLWGESREAQMPAIMEMLGIPYTGAGPLSMALCMNKARAKEMLSHYGIPTARFLVAQSAVAGIERFLTFPMMVKPLFEASSKGIRNDLIVRDPDELGRKVAGVLEEYGQPALVEEHLEGREFTVALLGNGDGLRTLPIVEIDCMALPEGVSPICSHDARLLLGTAVAEKDIFTCPADVNDRLATAIGDVAKDAFKALDVRDWCRIDVRLDSCGVPHVIELNPMPGLLKEGEAASCLPMAAAAAGMDYSSLVNGVVDIARNRYGL